VLVSLPIAASGVVFGVSLARSGEADRALASNLIGAVAGRIAEYLSMITGLQRLVAVVHLLAYLSGGRYRTSPA